MAKHSQLLAWKPPGREGAEDGAFAEHTDFRKWHADLQKNRGARALLRRADSLEKLITNPHFFAQLGRWPELEHRAYAEKELALGMVLGLCARVKQDNPRQAFGTQMAGQGGDRAPVKELRFQRLLKTEDPEDLLRQLRRCISLLGEAVNLVSLADFIVAWFGQQQYPQTGWRNIRFHLAQQYYRA